MVDTERANSGVSRGKLILIGVLGVVFVLVLVYQFSGDEPAKPTPRQAARRDTPASRRASPGRAVAGRPAAKGDGTKTADSANFAIPVKIEPLPLELVLQHNPFELPHRLSRAVHIERPEGVGNEAAEVMDSKTAAERPTILVAAEEVPPAVQKLRTQGIAAILTSGSETVAWTGERIFRVGDMVDGLRVSEITAGGMVLTE